MFTRNVYTRALTLGKFRLLITLIVYSYPARFQFKLHSKGRLWGVMLCYGKLTYEFQLVTKDHPIPPAEQEQVAEFTLNAW